MEEYIEKPEISYEIKKEKGTFIKWVKAHKKELFLAGISIASLIGIILGIKNKDSIKELWAALQKSVAKLPADKAVMRVTENPIPVVQTAIESIAVEVTTAEKIIDVNKHIRNLPLGHKASPEKLLSAIANGIELSANQTWVDAYSKMCA